MDRLRGITSPDLPTSSMAEAEFNAGFTDWFEAGLAAGQIAPAADKMTYMGKYAAGQLEKAAGLLRDTREFGMSLKQEKTQLLRDNARRDELVVQRRDQQKEEERAVRDLRDQGRQIPTIDGADLGVLRTWVEQVGRAGRVARAKGGDILKFALSHSKGNLHEVIYAAYEDDAESSWETVRNRLVGLFLTAREATALIDVVFGLKQERGELMSAYCMRYSTAVQRAWPEKGLLKLGAVHSMIIKKFEDSLVEPIVRLAVRLFRPTSLEKAMAVARENEEGLAGPGGQMTTAHRIDEPMEVGAVQAHQSSSAGTQVHQAGTDLAMFKQIQGELKSLRKFVADRTEWPAHTPQSVPAPTAAPTIMVQAAPAPPVAVCANQSESKAPPRQNGFQNNPKTQCAFCKRYGHRVNKCREKKIVEKHTQVQAREERHCDFGAAQSGN